VRFTPYTVSTLQPSLPFVRFGLDVDGGQAVAAAASVGSHSNSIWIGDSEVCLGQSRTISTVTATTSISLYALLNKVAVNGANIKYKLELRYLYTVLISPMNRHILA
jgi:hypothetical protein